VSDGYLSEIRAFTFNFAPRYWAQCNGQLLPIGQNQPLFALLGTYYGGDGRVNFALPDLRSRLPIHSSPSIKQGSKLGEEQHTLTVNEMAVHQHLLAASSAAATSDDPLSNVLANAAGAMYASSPGTGPVTLNAGMLGSAGSGQSHSNIQPYGVVNWCICTAGVFPTRS
jgi:microcystin-dependent protein